MKITAPRARRYGAAASVAAAGLLVLAACGSNGGEPAVASEASHAAGTTVAVQDAGGMSVLTTSSGLTLYTSDQEKGRALCTSTDCTAVWQPLTVATGQKPTGPADVVKDLSTIARQDGSRQVTFDGRPLYTFSLDHTSGQDNGNGQSDSFDGTDFTWHAATPEGPAATSGSSSSSSSSGGSGYGY